MTSEVKQSNVIIIIVVIIIVIIIVILFVQKCDVKSRNEQPANRTC